MQTSVTPDITEEYEQNGVVCVRQLVDQEWVEKLRRDVAEIIEGPAGVSVDSVDAIGASPAIAAKVRRFRIGMNGWMTNDAYHALFFQSHVPRVAAQIMRSRTARVFYDQTLVKEPGTTVMVDWHHDEPFWPVTGRQVCSVWIALDEVTKERAAVHYAKASHLSPQRFRPPVPDTPDFRALNLVNMELPLCPNLFNDPKADLLCWDMKPGDALIFNSRTLHGSGANLSDQTRRAIAFRFLGDDARYVAGLHVLSLGFPEQPLLKTGEPFAGEQFPLVWSEA